MKPSFRLLILLCLRYLVRKQINPWGPSPRDQEGTELLRQLDDAIEEEKKETE